MTRTKPARLMVDTNVLLYASSDLYAQHSLARAALLAVGRSHCELCISPQIAREFLRVATGKPGVEVVSSVGEAVEGLHNLLLGFKVVTDNRATLRQLFKLASTRSIQYRQIHDASIVAIMLEHDVEALLTSNPKDFAAFVDLISVIPLETAHETFR